MNFIRKRTLLLYAAIVVPMMLFAHGCAKPVKKPLVIHWGQTVPDTRLLRKHVAYWEEYLPFDGIVIPVNQQRYTGRYGGTSSNLLSTDHWGLREAIFSGTKADMADYQHAIDDLKAIMILNIIIILSA